MEIVERILAISFGLGGQIYQKDIYQFRIATAFRSRFLQIRLVQRTPELSMDAAGARGQVGLLEFWKTCVGPIKGLSNLPYSEKALDEAVKNLQTPVIEWWLGSGLALKCSPDTVLDAALKGQVVCIDLWNRLDPPDSKDLLDKILKAFFPPSSTNIERWGAPEPAREPTPIIPVECTSKFNLPKSLWARFFERIRFSFSALLAIDLDRRLQMIQVAKRWFDDAGKDFASIESDAVEKVVNDATNRQDLSLLRWWISWDHNFVSNFPWTYNSAIRGPGLEEMLNFSEETGLSCFHTRFGYGFSDHPMKAVPAWFEKRGLLQYRHAFNIPFQASLDFDERALNWWKVNVSPIHVGSEYLKDLNYDALWDRLRGLVENVLPHNRRRSLLEGLFDHFSKNLRWRWSEVHHLDWASVTGNTAVFSWWKASGIQLHYSAHGLDVATLLGHYQVLDWWIASGLEVRYTTWLLDGLACLDDYCAKMDAVVSRLKTAGLELRYTTHSMDILSSLDNVEGLEWWRRSGLELKYTERAMDWASATGSLRALDWWKQSGLDLKFTERSLEVAVYGQGKLAAAVLQWWIESGIKGPHRPQSLSLDNALSVAFLQGFDSLTYKLLDVWEKLEWEWCFNDPNMAHRRARRYHEFLIYLKSINPASNGRSESVEGEYYPSYDSWWAKGIRILRNDYDSKESDYHSTRSASEDEAESEGKYTDEYESDHGHKDDSQDEDEDEPDGEDDDEPDGEDDDEPDGEDEDEPEDKDENKSNKAETPEIELLHTPIAWLESRRLYRIRRHLDIPTLASLGGDVELLDWWITRNKAHLALNTFQTKMEWCSDRESADLVTLVNGIMAWKGQSVVVRPMDAASFMGHLSVLEWWKTLSNNADIPRFYGSESIDLACLRGDVATLDWWHKSGLPLPLEHSKGLELASALGHAQVLEWWAKMNFDLPDVTTRKRAVDRAVMVQHGSLVWWLHHGQLDKAYIEEISYRAASQGKVRVLEYLLTPSSRGSVPGAESAPIAITEKFAKNVIAAACQAGQISVLKWWRSCGFPWMLSASALHYANLKLEDCSSCLQKTQRRFVKEVIHYGCTRTKRWRVSPPPYCSHAQQHLSMLEYLRGNELITKELGLQLLRDQSQVAEQAPTDPFLRRIAAWWEKLMDQTFVKE
jgi:hypothetical protein